MSSKPPRPDFSETLTEFDRPTSVDSTKAGARTTYTLLIGDREMPLRGLHVLGRSAECEVVIEDALVSRRHAALKVGPAGVVLEDLGSVNGVFVNGVRVSGSRGLRAGDRLVIGKQEMTLLSNDPLPDTRAVAPTLTNLDMSGEPKWPLPPPSGVGLPVNVSEPIVIDEPDEASEATHRGDALDLLGGVADKVLALGRGEEAERILSAYLENTLRQAEDGNPPDAKLAAKAAGYAVKLAAATRKGSWVDYAIRLYSTLRAPMPASSVDELYDVLRKASAIDLRALRAYIALLRSEQKRWGPAERFVVQRIEGLERVAAR